MLCSTVEWNEPRVGASMFVWCSFLNLLLVLENSTCVHWPDLASTGPSASTSKTARHTSCECFCIRLPDCISGGQARWPSSSSSSWYCAASERIAVSFCGRHLDLTSVRPLHLVRKVPD